MYFHIHADDGETDDDIQQGDYMSRVAETSKSKVCDSKRVLLLYDAS